MKEDSKKDIVAVVGLVVFLAVCLVAFSHAKAQMQAFPSGGQTAAALPSGTLYEDTAATVITVTTGGTYYPWISATLGPLVAGMTADVTDAAGDHLIVPIDGTYLVVINSSYTAGNNDITQCRAALSGTGSDEVRWERTMSAAAAVGDASAVGLIAATASQEFRFECTSNTNGDQISLRDTQLTAIRVGP